MACRGCELPTELAIKTPTPAAQHDEISTFYQAYATPKLEKRALAAGPHLVASHFGVLSNAAGETAEAQAAAGLGDLGRASETIGRPRLP